MLDDDYLARFGGMARLYGAAGLERLHASRVAIVGIGGVGSWVAESLARSGVGNLVLIDLDDVCVTNVNRQIHALTDTVGKPKVEVMAQRILQIHPHCQVEARATFFTASNAESILSERWDLVIDAIDSVKNKCLLIAEARARKVPLLVCGGAGGRRDPTRIRIADLAATSHDPLLTQVRSDLRKQYHFPKDPEPFGIETVYTTELPLYPHPDGTVCANKPERGVGEGMKLNCEAGFGSASFVTGAFGLTAASRAVRRLCGVS